MTSSYKRLTKEEKIAQIEQRNQPKPNYTSSSNRPYTSRDVEFWEQRLRALKKIPNPNDAVKHSIRSAEARIKEIPRLRKQAIEKSTTKRLKQLEGYKQTIKDYPKQSKYLQNLIDRAPMSMNAGQYRNMLKKVESDYEKALYETEHTVPVQGEGDELPPLGVRKVGSGDNEKEVLYWNQPPGEKTNEVGIQSLPSVRSAGNEKEVPKPVIPGDENETKINVDKAKSTVGGNKWNYDKPWGENYIPSPLEFELGERLTAGEERAQNQVRGSVLKNKALLKNMNNEQIQSDFLNIPDMPNPNEYMKPGLKDAFKRNEINSMPFPLNQDLPENLFGKYSIFDEED